MTWQTLALRAARREAALRRFHRRIHDMGIAAHGYGAYKRRQKRMNNIDRDSHRLRLKSVVLAVKAGVEAEPWQDVYYREMERLGERAPPGVTARFRQVDATPSPEIEAEIARLNASPTENGGRHG